MYFRLRLVSLIIFAFALMIIARLVWLQVFQQKFYYEHGSRHYQITVKEEGLRGILYDRRGEELAVSSPITHLIVEPAEIFKGLKYRFDLSKKRCKENSKHKSLELTEFCQELTKMGEAEHYKNYQLKKITPLARLLDETPEYFLSQIQSLHNQGIRNTYYRKNIQPDKLDEVFSSPNKRVPGTIRQNNYVRFYPTIELMSRVLGRTGGDKNADGLSGLEEHFNDILKPKDGKIQYLRTYDGEVIDILPETQPPEDGQAVYLSLDRRIQFIASEVLEEALKELQAKSAHAIVTDVQTGEILAMVSLPSANPNFYIDGARYEEKDREIIDSNPIISNIIEAGSVMKPIFIASALDEKVITPNRVFQVPRQLTFKGGTITDTSTTANGRMNITQIISKSSNVGMALISKEYPREKFYPFMQKMGFGSKILGIKREQMGILHNPLKMRIVLKGGKVDNRPANAREFANMSFGYNISVTLIQVAQAYSIIANNGLKVPLTILKQDTRPQRVQRVISESSAKAVQKMLKSAVSGDGTGSKANTEAYSVAGKTGTSHKNRVGGYDNKHYIALFAGFAPADNPRIVIVVMLDEPNKDIAYFGGAVAAPQFSKIAEHSLKVLGLLPDKIQFSHQIELEKPEPEPKPKN